MDEKIKQRTEVRRDRQDVMDEKIKQHEKIKQLDAEVEAAWEEYSQKRDEHADDESAAYDRWL